MFRIRIACALLTVMLGCSSDDGVGADASSDAVIDVHVVVDAAKDVTADAGPDVLDATFDRPALPQIPLVSQAMSSPKLVTIIAGNDDSTTALGAFSASVPASKFWTSIATEYQLGAITAAATLTGSSLSGVQTSATLGQYVASAISSNAALAPNGNTIYLIYLPKGATIGGTFANDCGYHTAYPQTGSTGDQMAIVQRCVPYGGESQVDELTIIASHEIAESATDPIGKGYTLGTMPAQPWTASVWRSLAPAGQIELGDLCEGTRIYEASDAGTFAYQRTWSNQGAKSGSDPCIPPASDPYESIAPPKEWTATTAGAHLSIPIEGWSIAPAQPWLVQVDWTNGTSAFTSISASTIALSTANGIGTKSTCTARQGMTTGSTGTITLDVPTTAKSGDFGVLYVYSFREDTTCYPPLTEDAWHAYLIGVYVP